MKKTFMKYYKKLIFSKSFVLNKNFVTIKKLIEFNIDKTIRNFQFSILNSMLVYTEVFKWSEAKGEI